MKQILTGIITAASLAAGGSALAQLQGPSTQQTSYVVPTAPGVVTISIASNGDGSAFDFANETFARTGGGTPYRLVGIPDGMGAYDNGDGTFTMLVNHEIGATSGIARDHGTAGAFVSEWIVNKSTFAVVSAQDLVKTVAPVSGGAAPFGRLCSADLAAPTAYFNSASGLGSQARIFLSGEETGSEGRLFGHVATGASKGTSFYLPDHGKFSWENAVANPFMQDQTIVISTDDSTPGQVYMYVGTKKNVGSEVDKAGLTGGSLYGLKTPVATDTTATPPTGAASFVNLSAFATGAGTVLDTQSRSAGVTDFARPEDGAWNPLRPNEFFFVTTGSASAPTRLFRLTLNDLANPANGGVVDMLLDGTEGIVSLDNLCVYNGIDGLTRVIIQEDPGSSSRLAKIWMYTVEGDALLEVAQHSPERFDSTFDTDPLTPGVQNSSFLTTNEEASGIIDASDILGEGWFLMDVQNHRTSSSAELVEGGQLSAIYIPQAVPEPSTLLAFLSGAAVLLMRRRRKL